MADAGVNLGSAYGSIQIDTSQINRQLNSAFQTIERQAGNAMQRVGAKIQATGDKIAGVGSTLTVWTAPLAAAGGFGLKTFSKFEDVLAEIEARTGATGEQMDAVQQKALEMGAATAFSATDAANAILQLLASGYDLKEAFAALPAVLDTAAAGGMDLGYTADVVTDALAMWGLGADSAGMVADVLTAGAGASSAEINDLAQGLSNVGPIADEFGLSLKDTVAILAAFSERGIKGAEAGTQLRSMLNNMTRDTEDVTGMWEQLGISMYDTEGNVRPLRNVLNELAVSFGLMTEEDRITAIKTLAGSYGQLGLSVLTSEDAMGAMLLLMNQQADASTVAAARMDTLSGRTESLMGSIETLAINGLEPFIENRLKPFIEKMIEVVNKVNEWAMANPELTEKIATLAAILVTAGPVLFVVGKAIAVVGAAIAFLASPIGIAIAAIAALYVAYEENWLGIGDAVDAFVAWFRDEAAPVIKTWIVDELIPAIEDFWAAIQTAWETAEPYLALFYAWFVQEALPAIRDFIVNTAIPAIGDLIEIVKDVWRTVSPYLRAFSDWFLLSMLPQVRGFIVDTVIPAVRGFINTLKDIWDVAGPKLQEFYNFVMNQIGALKSSVIDPMRKAFNDLIKPINDVANALSSIGNKVPSWLIPGSPTPFEMGIRGIANAMSGLDNVTVPALAVNGVDDVAGIIGNRGPAGGGDTYQINLQITPDTIAQYPDAAQYATVAGDTLEARLRGRQRYGGGGVARG